jgi:hypothetical protein
MQGRHHTETKLLLRHDCKQGIFLCIQLLLADQAHAFFFFLRNQRMPSCVCYSGLIASMPTTARSIGITLQLFIYSIYVEGCPSYGPTHPRELV